MTPDMKIKRRNLLLEEPIEDTHSNIACLQQRLDFDSPGKSTFSLKSTNSYHDK